MSKDTEPKSPPPQPPEKPPEFPYGGYENLTNVGKQNPDESELTGNNISI